MHLASHLRCGSDVCVCFFVLPWLHLLLLFLLIHMACCEPSTCSSSPSPIQKEHQDDEDKKEMCEMQLDKAKDDLKVLETTVADLEKSIADGKEES